MRIEVGAVRLTFAIERVKHNQNGSLVAYLLDKTGAFRGDLYLTPEEARKLIVKPVRRINNRGEGHGIR